MLATSWGVVTFLSGVDWAIKSNTSGVVTALASVVFNNPPETTFALTPYWPNSAAILRVKPIKPARSEERRVGKEGRSRRARSTEKKIEAVRGIATERKP